ncbi:hypothetical protein M2281_002190 [Mesorhizobium soli]|uniref:hypothetical protein n=1 Tax=Pseudaminobacter soli (ex Li et al. 2025) TaxID=1295366 RepID=UPI00247602EF|nr:hypothetical protein [Mesorhizobium soli]MDH6231592.1 hypothetical protein [Mesorhizobium soli]
MTCLKRPRSSASSATLAWSRRSCHFLQLLVEIGAVGEAGQRAMIGMIFGIGLALLESCRGAAQPTQQEQKDDAGNGQRADHGGQGFCQNPRTRAIWPPDEPADGHRDNVDRWNWRLSSTSPFKISPKMPTSHAPSLPISKSGASAKRRAASSPMRDWME